MSGKGFSPNLENIAKIVSWPTSITSRQVKQLADMGSYYRRYVKNLATMVRPMVELTKKGKRFVWSIECEAAFAELKRKI